MMTRSEGEAILNSIAKFCCPSPFQPQTALQGGLFDINCDKCISKRFYPLFSHPAFIPDPSPTALHCLGDSVEAAVSDLIISASTSST